MTSLLRSGRSGRLIEVPLERLVFRVHIHQSAEASQAVTFWSDVVEAPRSQFRKCTIKTHNPRTVRKNIGPEYHGCLVVYVRNSAVLNLQIEGWCQGAAEAASGPKTGRYDRDTEPSGMV